MAKKNRRQNKINATSTSTRSFNKGMMKDANDSLIPDGTYFNARNAVNNDREGDLGVIGNEASNLFCTAAPYTIIGSIHLYDDKWAIFSTDNNNSEVGLFDESECRYLTIVNDICLNFKLINLVIGESKENFNCTWQIYWVDALNPDRTMNIGNIEDILSQNFIPTIWPGVPYVCTDTAIDPTSENPCIVCEPDLPLKLDCEKIRLDKLVTMPCINVSLGAHGGELQNGSYQVCVAYAQNDQRVTDYSLPSNVQPIFAHQNVDGSLDIEITNIDQDYDAYELVLIRTVNQQTVAKRMGLYNASQGFFSIDRYNEALPSVPLELLPLQRPSYEKSEGMYRNGDYLLRTAPSTKLDFNYQPLANQIQTKWVSVEVPTDYYRKGGNLTSYLRDEQYSFFIRWVYNTGDKSASYHIPGRGHLNLGETTTCQTVDAIEDYQGYTPEWWEVYNTGELLIPSTGNFTDPKYDTKDGQVIAEGWMGYWESTERYPDNKPEVWGPLCGKPIRHHKMPDYCMWHFDNNDPNNPTSGGMRSNEDIAHFKNSNTGNNPLRLIGLRFETIKAPVKNPNDPVSQQVVIDGIVGYEILRGSREGNKTILAKGLINNMRGFDLADTNVSGQGVKGLYPNYPYNDLSADQFFSEDKVPGKDEATPTPLTKYYKDIVTFHSPDTSFKKPFLGEDEIKVNMLMWGNVEGHYNLVEGHPKNKIITNFAFISAGLIGLGVALLSLGGKRTTSRVVDKPGHNAEQLERKWKINARTGGSMTNTITTSSGLWAIYGAGTMTPGVSNINTNQGGGDGDNASHSPAGLTCWTYGAGNLFQGYVDGKSNYTTTIAASPTLPPTGSTSASSNIGVILNHLTQSSAQQNYVAPPNIEDHFRVIGDYTLKWDENSTGFSGLTQKVMNLPMLSYYWNQGTSKALNIIKNLIPYRNYAIAAKSHCHYNKKIGHECGTRRLINNANYLDNHMQDFNVDKPYLTNQPQFERYRINNLFRSKSVVIATKGELPAYDQATIGGPSLDNSRVGLSELGQSYYNYDENGLHDGDPDDNVTLTSSWSNSSELFGPYAVSYYTSIKNRLRNQYGQLDSIIQVPASSCISKFEYNPESPQETVVESGVILGGDTYVGRYSEKNTMFFFYDWMFGQPDGFEFNYRLRYMLPYATYWMDTKEYDTDTFIAGLWNMLSGNIIQNFGPGNSNLFPSTFHNLDKKSASYSGGLSDFTSSLFFIRDAYIYLFNSGVRDFYLESEVNIDLRDWDDVPEKRYFDPFRYTDINSIFETSIIKAGNYNKYDYSLSISSLYQEFSSWGNMQYRDYDPEIAEKCYTYWPNRIIYSLPQHKESRYDGWTSFLVNNYRDFISKVTDVRSVGLGGAYILFDSLAPAKLTAEDDWKYGQKQKLTIGDGGLFSQPLQHVVNADPSFEYGSCQDRMSVTNTPAGLFYMSQNQGKVFEFTGELSEVSALGMKWWFERYLSYKILEDFPNFDLTSNPVVGVGCQTIYDNSNGIVYFCKKDYKLNPKGEGTVTWVEDDDFITDSGLRIKLGDPAYFLDASWTVSYDPKAKYWVSFHDWYPDLALPGKNTFMTTKEDSIWTHNIRCDSYGNYYGEQHPFEVDLIIPTGQIVNALKSYEYELECYIWSKCKDKFHDLDYNFDEAILYNSEQVSGLLKLNLSPKNDVNGILSYPQINTASGHIDILYNKVEQRYRFNQFWDITRDRGEFPIIPGTYSQQPIWDTEYNGYIRNLNLNNLDYTKVETQRKKFRHYANMIRLTRREQTNREMWFKIFNQKELYSPR